MNTTRYTLVMLAACTVGFVFSAQLASGAFQGTNDPGQVTNFSFTIGPGVTNFSLSVSNTVSSWSYLLLKYGGPASVTNYDFVAQFDGRDNVINLELPEMVVTNYGLCVRTPLSSDTNAFEVVLTTNTNGLRSAALPAMKPQATAVTGTLAEGQWEYFRIEIPTNSPGWRLVLNSSGTGPASLYLRRGSLPDTDSYDRAVINQTNATITVTDVDASLGAWFVGVYQPTGTASYTLYSEVGYLAGTLTWDPGAHCSGDNWFVNTNVTGGDYYFAVTPQAVMNGAWRTVLQVTGGEANLYLAQGWLPTTASYYYASTNVGSDELVLFPSQFDTNQTWFVLVHATPGAQWSLLTGDIFVQQMNWDPGIPAPGTEVYTNTCNVGQYFFFHISSETTAIGVWRTALNVLGGEADVYLRYGSLPWVSSYDYGSERVGSDGFVLAQGQQFSPGQEWYLLVHSQSGAQWNLVSGEAYAYDLGPLAADGSSSTNVSVGAEGAAFFKTTTDAETAAWSLWLHGGSNMLYVRKSQAALPISYAWGEPVPQSGQMLVVPDYLASGVFNGYYFVTVPGDPGTPLQLDSRKETVTDIAFNSIQSSITVTNCGYRTYRVQVPVQQIAWELRVIPLSGNPNLAVRRDKVPNEWNNDAYSEAPGSIVDSLTLVPPTLSDGTFFITVYGNGPYSFSLRNGNPVITDVPFLGSQVNDDTNRVGWTFYRVTDIESQLGTLGWELLLQNAPPGTQISIRRNAVPGWWNYRSNNNTGSGSSGYVDASSTIDDLQQPGHQADVWYIGIYNPTIPLDNFTLIQQLLTPQVVDFDGTSLFVTNQIPGQWRFFRVDVPSDALGWDVRLVGVTNGSPQLVVSRDTLPTSLDTAPCPYYCWWQYGPTNWRSGYQWLNTEWTGCGGVQMLATGMGSPLEPGTYYVGVQDPNNTSSYTLLSRGIGTNYTITVHDLDFAAGTNSASLAVTEGDYYRVVVPSNAPNWKLQLSASVGEVLLKVQKDSLPNSGGNNGYGAVYGALGGQLMMKAGDEQWLLMPENGQSNVTAGTYYVLVASQGQNLVNNCRGSGSGLGTGSASYELRSWSEPVTVLPNTLSYGNDLVVSNGQAGGEMRFYQFNVPSGVASIEVRLENRVGNPVMSLNTGTALVSPTSCGWCTDSYGNYGGVPYVWKDGSLITVPNPQPGTYSLSVYASAVSGGYPDASYTLRVRAVPPTDVGFDGGSGTVTDQPAGDWHFFRVDVPADALGWDVRLVGVTNGSPQLVVSRDTLPTSLDTAPCPYYCWWQYGPTNWPSGYQWLNTEWTGCGGVQMLATGMGSPLEPGTYYVGVQDPNNTSSYTLLSRGIGTNYTITVHDLDFAAGTNSASLAVTEGDYYRVVVPSNAPNWKLQLSASVGEVLLKVQKDSLPNSGGNNGYGAVYGALGGQLMMKAGDEQWVLMPENGQSNVTAGTYYVLVASQGQNLVNNCRGSGSGLGTGSASYELHSGTEPVTMLPATLSYGNDLVVSNGQAGGEMRFYQFNVPVGVASIEVRLENRVGNPSMGLSTGAALVSPAVCCWNDAYGNNGGVNNQWKDGSLITIPNPQPGTYSLSVYASAVSGGYPDASYTLRVRAVPPIPLAFTTGQNSVSGSLADNERAFFVVVVPATDGNGNPIIGWRLDLSVSQGGASVRVRKDTLPDDTSCDGTSPWSSPSAYIVPPYLTPGTWYVEVRGSGATEFTLTSTALTPERTWIMPEPGQPTTTPGLTAPLFGDSGVDTNGNPILDPQTGTVTDQGIDLEEGRFDYYAIIVPTNNLGVFRTVLQAISGNPDLYIRAGFPPSLSHGPDPTCWWCPATTFDRSQGGSTTQYGNWVPIDGRYATNLTAGVWYLAVQAAGNSNARYRLRVDTGNIQDLSLSGGSYAGQLLNGGDWRYYRVHVPTNAPANWNITFGQQVGDVVLYLRDTVPPGLGGNENDYRDWANDQKNNGPHPNYNSPGTYTLNVPPVRPGQTYYLGFRAVNDALFSVSSSTSGGVYGGTNALAFYGGIVSGTLPAYGSAIYRVDVPADAVRWRSYASHDSSVAVYLEQGTIPIPGWYTAHLGSPWSSDASWNIYLLSPNNWPWVPSQSYFLLVTNTAATPQPFTFTMDGRNLLTDDENNDGLPDYWQNLYFGYYWNPNAAPGADPDGDGVSNLQEYLDGTNPTDPNSAKYALTVRPSMGGIVSIDPDLPRYDKGTSVSLTAVSDSNHVFVAWSGDASGSNNPLSFTVSRNATVAAIFYPVNCNAPAGMVAWWPGESNAVDVVGGNNGTLRNGVGFTNGVVGQAFSFDGADDYVSIATTGSLTGTFTVEFWAMPTNPNNTLGLVGSRTPQDGSYDLKFYGGGIHGDIGNGSSWITTSADAAYSFTAGNWYHIASVVTPTNYTILINGVVAGSGSYAYGNPLLFDANHQLQIGYVGCYSEYMNGIIDEVSLYNRALTSNEVATIYLAGAAGKCGAQPFFLAQPQSQVVTQGATIVFSAAVGGIEPIDLQWYFNGGILTDATNATLTLSNVQSNSAGNYALVVCNPYGCATSSVATLEVVLLDNVGDGIPDWWRVQYFGGDGKTTNSQSCATCDADGTGQNNMFKYVAGLDPTNPASVFVLRIQNVPGQPTQMDLIYGPIASGRTYVLQSCTNLVGSIWTTQATSTPQTNGMQVTVTDQNANDASKFYRVHIYITTTRDSVGDGIPNWWRAQYFGGSGTTTNSQSCATCDADGTGQKNLFKYTAGLDPTNPASVFVLKIAAVPGQPNQKSLTYNPVMAGRAYIIQFTTNLVGAVWSTLTTVSGPQTNGTQATVTDVNATSQSKFYRVQISLTSLSLWPPTTTASVTGYNQISLNWSDGSGDATGFIVQRSVNGGAFDVLASVAGNTTNIVDSTVGCGNAYIYGVGATNASGISSYSYVPAISTSTYDGEGNGVPDCWRLQYFGHPNPLASDRSRSQDDADGTGQNNLFKYVAGLDPTNTASRFVLYIDPATGQPNQKSLTFKPWASGRTYTPEFRTNLTFGSYANLTGYDGPQTNSTEVSITDLNAVEQQKFYRIRISYP